MPPLCAPGPGSQRESARGCFLPGWRTKRRTRCRSPNARGNDMRASTSSRGNHHGQYRHQGSEREHRSRSQGNACRHRRCTVARTASVIRGGNDKKQPDRQLSGCSCPRFRTGERFSETLSEPCLQNKEARQCAGFCFSEFSDLRRGGAHRVPWHFPCLICTNPANLRLGASTGLTESRHTQCARRPRRAGPDDPHDCRHRHGPSMSALSHRPA